MLSELAPLYETMADPGQIEEWRACVLGRATTGDRWRKLVLSPVTLRGGTAVRLVRTIDRREEAETLALSDWPARLEQILDEPFDRIHLQTRTRDWHGRRTKRGKWLLTNARPSAPDSAIAAHDRERRYPLPPEHPAVRRLFSATGLLTAEGRVRGRAAGKYRQVQHYVNLLQPLPVWERARELGRPLRVVDAGCGKAYMSLALVLYGELQGVSVDLVGLDREASIVEQVRAIAAELGYEATRFEATTIGAFAAQPDSGPVDLLVSLHACDTATDEALAAGVALDAQAIVLAPCCQHELARQLSDAEGWSPVTRHSLLRRRAAELVTDGLRASALEALGYRAEAIEFVAAEHTAKNLMIRAVRRQRRDEAAERRALAEYRALASLWGVTPSLERLLGGRWPG